MKGNLLLKLFRRLLAPRPPKQIRFIDTCGNTQFLLPDGGSIVVTYASGEQFVKVCRYVDSNQAEIDGAEHYLSAFAEDCQRTGAAIAPESAPEYYENYRIVRKMPVPGNMIALGRDLNHYWRYVTLELAIVCDGYGYAHYHTEGLEAHDDFDRRVLEWQRGRPPRPAVALALKNRGESK